MLFSQGGHQVLYVGRVQSPQFIERLPAHFALGEGSWQNQFLKHHRDTNSQETLEAAAVRAADCELLLILAPPHQAARLEALLIEVTLPTYNLKKPKAGLPSPIPRDSTLRDVLEPLPLRPP